MPGCADARRTTHRFSMSRAGGRLLPAFGLGVADLFGQQLDHVAPCEVDIL